MRQADTRFLAILILTLCVGLFSSYAYAAEDADDNTVEAATDATPEVSVAPKLDFSDLASCSQVDGTWYWIANDDLKVELVGKKGSYIKAASPIGTVRIKKALFILEPQEYITAWFQILDNCKGLGAEKPSDSSSFIFGNSNITGPRFSSKKALVLRHVALIKQVISKPDFKSQIQAIELSAKKLTAAIHKQTDIDDLGKKSIDNVLKRLSWKDEQETQFDAVPPHFARRVVRNGWLNKILGKNKDAQAVVTTVALADSLQLVQEYSAGKESLKRLSNAFGNSSWLLVTKDTNVYTRKASAPVYHPASADFLRRLQTVTFLKPGVDPLSADMKASDAIRIVLENKRSREILASWSTTDGFQSNESVWRSYVNSSSMDIVTGWVPPHITQTNLQGDVIQIVTPHGSLPALDVNDSADSERFLSQAATVLPTGAYLDLIGEYMMTYVYDSPDSSRPLLIGTSDISSDIHQTALETLGTSCGGQFRGDCDDLSELYHNILVRQGKLPHVVSLPSHAAVAWAEEKEGAWHTYVLQTGPALEFSDSTLQNALRATYKHFDEGDTFDPNGLGLLLRFSGENTRSSWRLSYRIFSDPEYAQTMIDVQRDWHFQTYQHAIHKMLAMIEAGDDDTANFRELSGLYSFTGQYAKAAEYHAMSIERTPEATSKLFMTMELVQHLMDAGHKEQALEIAERVYNTDLPDLKDALGGAELQFALQMSGHLNHPGSYDLALKFLSTYVQTMVSQNTDKIGAWLNSPNFDANSWKNSGQLRQLRRIIKMYISSTLAILDKRGIADIHSNKIVRSHFNLIQHWMDTVGPYELDELGEELNAYNLVGSYYLTHMEMKTLLAKMDTVDLPTSTDFDHSTRISAAPQFAIDMQWVKLSVPFWFAQTTMLFDRNSEVTDKDLVHTYYTHAEAAFAACEKLEIATAFTKKQIHYMRVIHALINEDEKAMHQLLKHVKEKNDKRLRDDTAQWIGDCARSMSLDWFKKVTTIWTKELDYKPKYYWIAWRAALNKAPQHALYIASVAAKRFKDDPAFVEEYEFMKKLFATSE